MSSGMSGLALAGWLTLGATLMGLAYPARKHWSGEIWALAGMVTCAISLAFFFKFGFSPNVLVPLVVFAIAIDIGFRRARRWRATILAELATLIVAGIALRGRCFQGEDFDILSRDGSSFFDQLDALLKERLGEAYVVRVRNDAGLSLGQFYSPSRPDRREIALYGQILTRLARLEEFSREIQS